jgi:hypothetical protein
MPSPTTSLEALTASIKGDLGLKQRQHPASGEANRGEGKR